MGQRPDITIDSTAAALDDHYGDTPPLPTDKPRVLFPSDLKLTREQEDKLCAKAQQWFQLLDDQMGRSDTAADGMELPGFLSGNAGGGGTGAVKPERKFFSKRLLYQLIAENKMDFRKILNPGSIFATSNLVVPLARRIASQMGARAVNYFFGTEPWLEQKPLGGEGDMVLAMKLQKLTDVKFVESGSTPRLRRALPSAFIIGESVMKITKANEREFYRRLAVVAVDAQGNPFLAQDGEPITEEDAWDVDVDGGAAILARDGQTVKPEGDLVFKEVLLDEEKVFYSGPKVTQVYYRDFLCPLNARSIQEAECCIHMMEQTASQLAQAYMQSPGQSLEDIQRAVEGLRDALGGGNESLSGDRGARPELGEFESPQSAEATTEYGEFYLRVDADGDFLTEDIMLVMNPKTGYPIYYNYTANVTDDGKRPFRAIVPKPVLNRWYGQGAIEQFEEHQETVDLMVNRRNLSQSAAGRLTLFRGYNTQEGQHNPNLQLNWGKVYTPLPGKEMKDIIEVIYLDDNKYEALTNDLEFFLQLAMNESGVQHANDGNTAGQESTKLATGIRNIEKSGQELFGVVISELEVGITEVAQCFVTTLYANLDDEETFEFFEGDVPVEMSVAKRDVQGLRFNVQTLLTRYRDEQSLASNGQGYALLFGDTPFYMLDPSLQIIAAPFVRNQLKSLQIQRADDFVRPQMAPMGMAMPAAPPTGVPKESKTPQPNL